MVNKLPMYVRTRELVLAGLWFGKNKPDMRIFLNSFVENMNDLSMKGIQCSINGIEKNIKVFPLVFHVDSVARAPMQNFVQFNCNMNDLSISASADKKIEWSSMGAFSNTETFV